MNIAQSPVLQLIHADYRHIIRPYKPGLGRVHNDVRSAFRFVSCYRNHSIEVSPKFLQIDALRKVIRLNQFDADRDSASVEFCGSSQWTAERDAASDS